MSAHDIRVGCAGWSILRAQADRFPGAGSHLARYARRLPAVEVNSSFYRPHRPSTYARWAAETTEGFAFSVKVPREITHTRRLADPGEPFDRFLTETGSLGAKRGPRLVQFPPSLVFDAEVVGAFLTALRRRSDGIAVCEPRHPSWFGPRVDRLLAGQGVARVAADPAVIPEAAEPGGWDGLTYFRLHGSPNVYSSPYLDDSLDALAKRLARTTDAAPVWCIFDNTAQGAATGNALALAERLSAR